MREVGKVIRVLVGDFYHPLYLYKEFQKKLVDQKVPQSLTFKGTCWKDLHSSLFLRASYGKAINNVFGNLRVKCFR